MLEMQSFLAGESQDAAAVVGEPLKLDLDPAKYQPQVRFAAPQRGAVAGMATAAPRADGRLQASIHETDVSGIYQIRLTRSDGQEEVVRRALNVDTAEGDLKTVSGADLATRLEGVVYEYHPAALFQYETHDTAGYNMGEPLLYLLILLLLGEQVLAWSASYHPSAKRAAPGGAT
jgi:hypothetical protein